MAESWSGSPSPGKTLHKNYLQKTKKSSFPSRGTRTGNTKSCGTTLFAAHCGHFQNGANTPSALNAGNTSADTLDRSISPCPRRPIVLNRFSLRSQLCRTLCGCAFSFTPASVVSNYVMLFIPQMCAFVKHFFTSSADRFSIPGQRPGRCR